MPAVSTALDLAITKLAKRVGKMQCRKKKTSFRKPSLHPLKRHLRIAKCSVALQYFRHFAKFIFPTFGSNEVLWGVRTTPDQPSPPLSSSFSSSPEENKCHDSNTNSEMNSSPEHEISNQNQERQRDGNDLVLSVSLEDVRMLEDDYQGWLLFGQFPKTFCCFV